MRNRSPIYGDLVSESSYMCGVEFAPPWSPGSLTKGRVPHISLVFREMWDSTALSQQLSIFCLSTTASRSRTPSHTGP